MANIIDGICPEVSILDGFDNWPRSATRKEWFRITRERWQQHKRTTRKDVVRECNAYKDNDRKALRHLRSLEEKGFLESKADNTEIGFKPTE